MTDVRVSIDPDLCIGTGDCVRLAPAAFHLDASRGVSTVLEGAGAAEREVLEEAAFNCPTRAITVSRSAS